MTVRLAEKGIEECEHVPADVVALSSHRVRNAVSMVRRRLRRPRRWMAGGKREAGFTLVEVIVALSILSVGLSTLLGLISNSLRQTASAERMAEAGSLAQSLLADVGVGRSVKPEAREGEFPNGYRWHLTMLPFGDAREREEWPVGIYTISTEVAWEEGGGQRSYTLTTLRFGPKVARQ